MRRSLGERHYYDTLALAVKSARVSLGTKGERRSARASLMSASALGSEAASAEVRRNGRPIRFLPPLRCASTTARLATLHWRGRAIEHAMGWSGGRARPSLAAGWRWVAGLAPSPAAPR
ncbi:MAG: hypothetical protein AB1486_06685 [Planctomycetota bacterium]